jgi:homoserine kinase
VLSGTELTVGQTWDGKEVNEELLQLANEIEGHPDNVAPVRALLDGLLWE